MEQQDNIFLERAILVGLITPEQDERKANEYLDELEFLSDTAGAVTVKKFLQRLEFDENFAKAIFLSDKIQKLSVDSLKDFCGHR